MFKKIFIKLIFISLHIVSVGIILFAFLPVAKWYLNYRPIWGVDFYLLVSFASLLKNHLVMPFAFWNYAGFAGWPAFIYPSLHTYIVLFLSNFFDLIHATQLWMMVSTALFLIGEYFLFFSVSGNFLLSTILVVATAYSGGVYQTLTWAGSLPSYATQAALPWALFFLVQFLKSNKQKNKLRYLMASALVSGVSAWGHPLVFVVYIIPATFLLIFFDFSRGLVIFSKLKYLMLFLFISLLIALPLFYSTFTRVKQVAVQTDSTFKSLSTTSAAPDELTVGLAKFNQAQVKRVVTDNHILPFYLLGLSAILFLISLVVVRNKSSVLACSPYLVLAGYFSFYIWLFGQGISIFHGGWYRLFWSGPIWVGLVACTFWRQANDALFDFLQSRWLKIILFAGLNVLILALGLTFLKAFPAGITFVNLIPRSQASSAYPDRLNLKISSEKRNEIKGQLTPAWLKGDDTNFRLYDGDQTINIWWTSFFKMPLARGYIDPPLSPIQRGYIFWLDAALSEQEHQPQLVSAFHYPAETALSNAQFLIDWNAVRYFEGGHTGAAYAPMPQYLSQFVKNEQVLDFSSDRYTHRAVTLRYYEFKEEVTSPVLSATNTSTLGIIASDGGYETVIRAIAEKDNVNSRKLIPIKLGKSLDKYNLETLKIFDALYLYDYDYRKEEKTFKMLTEYVRSGKKVFIETGVEVKQSEGALPEFFPVKMVKRKGQGMAWSLAPSDNALNKGVDFKLFSPPVFDEDEWKTSSASPNELKDGASAILKNHDRIVMASQKLGSGGVIWSGLNYAYHVSRNHNQEEAKLFNNILGWLADISEKPLPSYNAKFINANSRLIQTETAKGILFKEEAYNGWRARLLAGSRSKPKSLEIFKAGPAYPGFMYIPIASNHAEVAITYGGSFENKILITTSFLVVILIFDEIIFRGLFLGRARKVLFSIFSKRLNHWWQKDEED